MTSAECIGEISLTIRGMILTNFQLVNSCIETTRLSLMVFEHFGIKARAQSVKVAIMNREAWEHIERQGDPKVFPPRAHALSVGHSGGVEPGGWNGHLVTMIQEQPRRMVDISADQFNRPGKVLVPGPMMMTIDSSTWTPQDSTFMTAEGGATVLDYRPFAPGDARGNEYKNSPAWSENSETFAEIARACIEMLESESRS